MEEYKDIINPTSGLLQKVHTDEWIASHALQGEQGINGIDGIAGEQGIQGIKGDKGDDGLNGNDGLDGEQGLQGEKGLDGINGVDGIDGQQGIQGIQGEKGDKGDKGDVGEIGTFSKCRVYLTNNQSIPASTYTVIQMSGINFDSLNEWNSINFRFVAKQAGYYLAHGNVRTSQYSGAMNMSCIAVNDVVTAKQRVLSTSVINNSVPTDLVYLNVGDYIQLMSYLSNVRDVGAGTDETFLFITRLA